MQNLWVIRGQCRWATGPRFFPHILTTGEAYFLENIYMGQMLFFAHFCALFFTLDTICADHKDKLMVGCKNQLI